MPAYPVPVVRPSERRTASGENPHVTTSQPAAGVQVWRIAAIGAVAILAVGIGIAMGSFLLGARGATIGSGATYVPASAPLYVEVRLEPSEAQDAAIREFLGRFPAVEGVDLTQPLYPQLTAKIDEALAAEGTDLSWSTDVEPWFDGRVGVAVLEIPASAFGMEAPEETMLGMPSTVLLMGVTDAGAAQASIDRILAESEAPLSFTAQEHAGETINVDDETGMAYALTEDQLLIAPAADDIIAALDAHATSATTLSEAGSISELTDALPDEWLVFGIYDFTDALAGALGGGGAVASPGSDVMGDLLANQSMRGAMALTVDGDRVSLPMVSDAPTGPLAVANAERGLADEVPGDALYYAEGGNIGGSLSGVVASLKETVAAGQGGTDQIDMLEAGLGGSLEELVAWIGDGAAAAGHDGEQPWGGAIIVPTDMEDARRTVDQLSTLATLATLDPSIGITVDERDVEGVEVTTLRWSDPAAADEPQPSDLPIPIAPSEVVVEWAVTDDRVLLGIGDRFVENVIGLDAGASLAETDRFADAVAESGGMNSAGVTWIDLRGLRTALEATLGDLDEAGMASYETDVAPWLEPLDRFLAVARIDGEQLRTESVLIVE
jgi:Protein of unknown function (DUF3352)